MSVLIITSEQFIQVNQQQQKIGTYCNPIHTIPDILSIFLVDRQIPGGRVLGHVVTGALYTLIPHLRSNALMC